MTEAVRESINLDSAAKMRRAPVTVFDRGQLIGTYEPPTEDFPGRFSFHGAVREVQPEALPGVLSQYSGQISEALGRTS